MFKQINLHTRVSGIKETIYRINLNNSMYIFAIEHEFILYFMNFMFVSTKS